MQLLKLNSAFSILQSTSNLLCSLQCCKCWCNCLGGILEGIPLFQADNAEHRAEQCFLNMGIARTGSQYTEAAYEHQ